MSEPDNNAGGAQGDTNATASLANAVSSVMDGLAAAPDQSGQTAAPAAAPQGNPGGTIMDQFAGKVSPEGGEQGDAGKDGATVPEGDYDLKFPEGVVADAEAVKALNEVGKEFGITGDKAQYLAERATEYGNRRVEAQMEHFAKGFKDFCDTNTALTRAVYGDKLQATLVEAQQGLDAVLRTMPAVNGKQITSADIIGDPNVKAITNVPWFIHMCKTLSGFMTEQPGVSGSRGGGESAGFKDVNWLGDSK